LFPFDWAVALTRTEQRLRRRPLTDTFVATADRKHKNVAVVVETRRTRP